MLCLLTVGFAALVPAPEMVAEARGARYGTVQVAGNTDTHQRLILNQLGEIRPGVCVSAAQLRAARKRLATLGAVAFRTPPVVVLVPNDFDSAFMNLHVYVEERPGNWFTFGLWSLCDHGIEAVKLFDPRPVLEEWAWFRYRWREEPPR